jgi:hypothetical protein
MENYGLKYLLMEGRKIWGERRYNISEIVIRTMVTVGDIARVAREWHPAIPHHPDYESVRTELKKELGNLIFSTIRFTEDLGFDVYECADLAIEAQKKFAASGKAR